MNKDKKFKKDMEFIAFSPLLMGILFLLYIIYILKIEKLTSIFDIIIMVIIFGFGMIHIHILRRNNLF